MKQSLLSILLVLSVFASCKNDDIAEPEPATVCRITTADQVTETDSFHIALTYSSDGKLARFTSNGRSTTLAYAGNLVYRTDPSGFIDTLTLNGDGLVVQTRTASSTGYATQTDYIYNGTEVQRAVQVHGSNGISAVDTTRYFWSGGNCIREETSFDTVTYTYTDMPAPASGGDPFAFRQLLFIGGPVVRNKDLIKARNISASVDNVTYETDADRKVTKATLRLGPPANETLTYRFGYTCQ